LLDPSLVELKLKRSLIIEAVLHTISRVKNFGNLDSRQSILCLPAKPDYDVGKGKYGKRMEGSGQNENKTLCPHREGLPETQRR
jgi:hypothetical protein